VTALRSVPLKRALDDCGIRLGSVMQLPDGALSVDILPARGGRRASTLAR
jgi:hypothetical protein